LCKEKCLQSMSFCNDFNKETSPFTTMSSWPCYPLPQSFYPMREKLPQHVAYHSLPFSAKIKNVWSFTSTMLKTQFCNWISTASSKQCKNTTDQNIIITHYLDLVSFLQLRLCPCINSSFLSMFHLIQF